MHSGVTTRILVASIIDRQSYRDPQIIFARLQGDFVLAAAHSRELPHYGVNHGLTNWAAGISIFMI